MSRARSGGTPSVGPLDSWMSMLGFFRDPYPDELLFSTFSRLYVLTQWKKTRFTAKLFGDISYHPYAYLPTHLQRFVDVLPFGHVHRVEGLIAKHTLLPYYIPFLTPREAETICRDMAVRDTMLGMGIRIKMNARALIRATTLKYCPLCLKDDRRQYGEAYWHREHQPTAAMVCVRHRVFLSNGRVECDMAGRFPYHVAESITGPAKPVPLQDNNPEHQVLLKLAIDTNWLLQGDFTMPSGQWIPRRYSIFLGPRGLAVGQGPLQRLQQAFLEFCPGVCLDVFVPGHGFTWILDLLKGGVRDPYLHLLMIQFLGLSVESFFLSHPIVAEAVDPTSRVRLTRIGVKRGKKYLTIRRRQHRQIWLNLLKRSPQGGASELDRKRKRTYRWLLKHDRAWYLAHRHKPSKSSGRATKWERKGRDREGVTLAHLITAWLMLRRERKRLTKTSYENFLRVRFDSRKLAQMPQCAEFFRWGVETTEQWYIRLMELTAEEFKYNCSHRGPIKRLFLAKTHLSMKRLKDMQSSRVMEAFQTALEKCEVYAGGQLNLPFVA